MLCDPDKNVCNDNDDISGKMKTQIFKSQNKNFRKSEKL